MHKPNRFRNIDFITIPLRYTPLQAAFSNFYAIVNALMPAYQTIVLADFIDCATGIFAGKSNLAEIFLPIILLALYVLFVNLMPALERIVSLTGKNRLTLALKGLILDKRASLEYRHVENTDTQELVNRACADTVGNFSGGFNNILSTASIIISSVSLLIIIMASAFVSGIVIVAVSIPLFIVAMRTGKRNYEMGKEAQKIQRRYKYLGDIMTAREYAAERKLFGYSGSLQKIYDALYHQSFRVESRIEWLSYINMKSGSLVTLLLIAAIVAALLPGLADGSITIGVFVALVNAVFGLVQSMSWRLAGIMREHARLQEYLKDLNAFFALSEKKDACAAPERAGGFVFESLEFRNVAFKYPGTDRYVLNDCSFRLVYGNSYAFVGVNGAGKSTITKLISGLYDNYEGEILLNGKSIREYSHAKIKAVISVLFQDFTAYSISLKDNIIIGKSMVYDAAKVEKIITAAGLGGLAQGLGNGLDTPLGKIKTGGVDVSGGQWQRIAIARLLYSDAAINILDEPTAALDPVAESQVYEMFHRVNNQRFTIYITHRLGAAKIADEILVVDGGKIAETGSHAQLMRNPDGLYREMFDSQKSWYEL